MAAPRLHSVVSMQDFRAARFLLLALSAGCSASTADRGPEEGDADGDADADADGDAPERCTPVDPAADITIDPAFDEAYAAFDLGAVPGMPPYKYGGLRLAAGDPDTLLIGGDANFENAAIYAVPLVRSCGHIVGFAGDAGVVAAAPYIDGGVEHGPDGMLLFTGYPVNTLGQILAGDAEPALTIDLGLLGIESSVGALAFVPEGFAGAGALQILSWPSGRLYGADHSFDEEGLLVVAAVTEIAVLEGGPEGFAYVPTGSPLFDGPRLIVSEWSANRVATYALTAAGTPDVATRRELLQGLSGAEGAFFDPATGDFLFSTWQQEGGDEKVIEVRGFAPIF